MVKPLGEQVQSFRERMAAAVRALRAGAAVVYPTETLYALGVHAFDRRALDMLVALKVRAPGKPISVLVAELEMLSKLVSDLPASAERLIKSFWPGPLTLVLPARPDVPEVLTGGSGTIGLRISSHPVAHELVMRLGGPVTAPSANPSGATPPVTVAAAEAYFGPKVAYYLDWGPTPGEPPTTVLAVTERELRVIRAGAVPVAAIEAIAAAPVVV